MHSVNNYLFNYFPPLRDICHVKKKEISTDIQFTKMPFHLRKTIANQNEIEKQKFKLNNTLTQEQSVITG